MTEKSKETRPELLIEESLPVRTIGIECEREGKGLYPPLNRLHVWWARRPLIASRAAILASVIDKELIDEDELLIRMGITGDTIEKYKTVDDRPDGTLVYEHYGYRRPFERNPTDDDLKYIHQSAKKTWGGDLPTVFDATAGGGAIPFESIRHNFPTIANELNPVASIVLKAVLSHPKIDKNLSDDIYNWGMKIHQNASNKLARYFHVDREGEQPVNYLWANTITCPDCRLHIPLSPNWWLNKKGSSRGIAVNPTVVKGKNQIDFELIHLSPNDKDDHNPNKGTISHGKASCLRCNITVDGDEVKRQAQENQMGLQLYAVEYKDPKNQSRGNFREPTKTDVKSLEKAKTKIDRNPELSTFLSLERYVGPADRSANYGLRKFRDIFNPRQLLTHYHYLEAFNEIKPEVFNHHSDEEANAILTYLAIVGSKALNYNSRFSGWHPHRAVMQNTFDRHDFAFMWSFGEMNLTVDEVGYEWPLSSVIEAYEELYDYLENCTADPEVLNFDASDLPLDDNSVEVIVLDPPYYDNVMYAELSDFFYVWLKKYLGDVYPEFFGTELTPKEDEAIANTAKFENIAGENQSKTQLAQQEYESKMADIFSELNRVLTDDGVFTLMFTHKRTEAWDTLTKALIDAEFSIHASHPISTENPRSLHQQGKNAARSTIFLVCRKRLSSDNPQTLWSEVKEETREVALENAKKLDQQDIEFSKVDMILSSFGPTLEVFSSNYPVIDDEGNEVRPQTALDEARNAVRDYLIERYLHEGIRNVDPITEWYTLAWLVFEAQRFPYDEGNRLGKGIGIEVDDIKRSHRLWRKKSNDLVLRSHDERVQTPEDKEKSRTTKPIDPDAITFDTDLDKVHAVMYVFDKLGAIKTEKYIKDRGLETDPGFRATFEALLQVISPTHDDWELLRDIAATDIADLIDIDLDSDVFQRAETDGSEQGKLSSFD